MKRIYNAARNYRAPGEKALEDYRHRRGTKRFYKHEYREVSRQTKRSLRRKLKRELYNEAYYRVVPHDYKTYG